MKKDKIRIGLEVHIPLNTKSKLFCNCSTVGIVPNESVCEICLGMPGSKPKLNENALNKTLKVALAFNCEIQKQIIFSRKIYFYPDLCKNFQITQHDAALGKDGFFKLNKKKISIWRVQLEEDPGRLQHKNNYSLIDYNRSGVPLVELITGPDFYNSDEVLEFLQKLHNILDYLELHDSKNFSVRADVNVSINNGNRVEIKNISGNKNIEKAIDFEVIRQKFKIKKGEIICQETKHFDPDKCETFSSRSKENEADYGYILEPDLSVLKLDSKFIKEVKNNIPELPFQRFNRMKNEYSLNSAETFAITSERAIADLFENLYKKVNKKYLKNWIVVSLKKVLNYNNIKLKDTGIEEKQIEDLINKILNNELNPRAGEFVLRELVERPNEIDKIIKKLKLSKLSKKELDQKINKCLIKNKKVVEEYKNGKSKALQFLIGQLMRETNGKVDAKKITKIITKKIKH